MYPISMTFAKRETEHKESFAEILEKGQQTSPLFERDCSLKPSKTSKIALAPFPSHPKNRLLGDCS